MIKKVSIEEEKNDNSDWDWDYLEYIWYTILSRTGIFENTTPRNLFSQFDIWKKINGMEEGKEKAINKLNSVEEFF